MKKAIVTGASGFIGSALINELQENGVNVIAIARNKNSNIDKIKDCKNLRIIFCELSDISSIFNQIKKENIDTFFHLAWDGTAGDGRFDQKLQSLNVQYTIDAVKFAHAIGAKRFIGAGTIMEYEAEAAIHNNGNLIAPSYIYGISKFYAHSMSKIIAGNLGIEHIWPVITNAYGVGELSPRLINSSLRMILKGENLQFTSGEQNYDFVYISDVSKALYLIGLYGRPFYEYLIGSSHAKPLKEFIIEMCNIFRYNKFRFGDIPYSGVNLPIEVFDTSITEKDTTFRARISFAEGIKKTVEWLRGVEKI